MRQSKCKKWQFLQSHLLASRTPALQQTRVVPTSKYVAEQRQELAPTVIVGMLTFPASHTR